MPYKCKCGYSEENKGVFLAHFRHNKGDGHKSQGYADLETGELRTLPPSKVKVKEAASTSPPGQTHAAATIAEAQTLAIYPKRFGMSSVLLWQAREAAIREWGWCNRRSMG